MRTVKIYSLSNFQIHNTVLLTIVTMLYIIYLGLIYIIIGSYIGSFLFLYIFNFCYCDGYRIGDPILWDLVISISLIYRMIEKLSIRNLF